jgi:hypothetical protein
MTMSQLYALCTPLILAAIVWLTALFTRRPWAEKPAEGDASSLDASVVEIDVVNTLNQAEKLIREVRYQLQPPAP